MAIQGFAGSKPAMSRTSRKSELSPSITRSSGGIDLGKNDIDMGSKGQTTPSVTSGGIGVSTEITNVGGLTVTGGVSVDISPIDIDIKYDPSENSLGIAGGAEIPGGLLGASGGITIDIGTGEVIGGQIGGEALGLGVNVSASKDGGLGVEFTVQIPFTPIELSVSFGYSPNKTPTPTPTPTPAPTPTPTPTNLPPNKPSLPTAPIFPVGTKDFCKVVVNVERRYWSWQGDRRGSPPYQFGNDDETSSIVNGSYDKEGILTGSVSYYDRAHHWNLVERNPGPFNRFYENKQTYQIPIDPYPNIVNSFYPLEIRPLGGDAYEVKGNEQRIYNYIKSKFSTRSVDLTQPNSGVWEFYQHLALVSHTISLNLCILPETEKPPPPFPNPPPRKRNKMDTCCQENLKFLRAIYTRLGLAKFPGKLPATIIQEVLKEGEAPTEPPQVPIADLTDLLMWQFERDDERWGQWEIQINIKDADLTKEGNQGKSVKFPNLAESVAEMEGQILSIQSNVEALVALSIRNLTESGMARQEAIKGYLATMAIVKYMAFPYKEIPVEIPSTYTPGAISIDKLIVETIVHTKSIDYEAKETQRDLFLDLLQAAAIIRAVHWRQINPKDDMKKQILSQLRGSVDLSEKITNVKAVAADSDTPQKKESWEDKLDQYENGFGFSTGIEDPNTPYGRDRNRRPRIRQIGDNLAQAGKDE